MKTSVKALLIAVVLFWVSLMGALVTTAIFLPSKNTPNIRTMYGTYYDYLVVVTEDNHEWEVENNYSDKVPFKTGEKVLCKFKTMGTADINDDYLYSIESVK